MKCPRCKSGSVVGRVDASCLSCGWAPALTERRAGDAVEEPRPVRRRDIAPSTGTEWTETDREWALAHLGTMTIAEIAEALGRTTRGVQMWLWKQHIAKPRAQRSGPDQRRRNRGAGHGSRYTEEEIAWLLDNAQPGFLSKVRNLSRSPQGAYRRLYREGERLMSADGMMSAREAALQYGVSPRTVAHWLVLGVLRGVQNEGSRYWRIDPEEAERIEQLTERRRGRPRRE